MQLEVLIAIRRTLKSCQAGLPIPEALALIDWILDGLDADETEQSLDDLITAALSEDTETVAKLRSQIRMSPYVVEEAVYGQ